MHQCHHDPDENVVKGGSVVLWVNGSNRQQAYSSSGFHCERSISMLC